MKHAANLPTLAQALQEAQTLGLARLDAQLLLLHLLQRPAHDRAWLFAHDRDALAPDQAGRWQTLLQRRLDGEPLAYIVGRKAFYGLDLQVDARVLDPRDDTETLVAWGLDLLAARPQEPAPCVLDLGTGSGAVALALQSAWPAARVHASDASADALAVARANALALQLPLQLAQGHWLDVVAAHWPQRRFDLIVSNPPYVAAGDPHLARLQHEPRQALVAGEHGLADLRCIVQQAPAHLLPGAWLLLEHGWDQAEAVRQLLRAAGFAAVQSRTDLAGIARCSGGQWPGVK